LLRHESEREDHGDSAASGADGPPADYDVTDRRTRNQRHADEIAAQEERFERERRAFKREERRERRQRMPGLSETEADQRVAQLEAVMAEALNAAGTALEAMEIELSRMHTENRDLKTRQTELETQLAELKLALVEQRGKVIDMPNPLRSVN
jgi:DNA repair exonuclease SbcCD ATPase subunit